MEKINASILVVDDDEEMLALCAGIAGDVAAEVAAVSSSDAAREAFRARTFDLLLTDLNIDAQGDGVDLTREIHAVSPGTRVVMMTAAPSLETAIGGLKSGASEYIIKPFSVEHLSSVLRSVLEKAALSAELEHEKALKKELEDAYAELKASERAKDAFLGRVNHELRTPLAIAGASLELLGPQLAGGQRDLWLRADKGLKWLRLEIDELLLYSGLLKNELKIVKAPADLWKLLNDTAASLKFLCDEMQVAVGLQLEGEPWPVTADAGLLREAFRQLLVNGVKFNRKGGSVTALARYLPDRAVFLFSDTGPGVPDKDMPHLFDSFFQAADYLTREVGGIGLGLATVKRIVEAHGGSVAAQRNTAGGMVFSFTLPRAAV